MSITITALKQSNFSVKYVIKQQIFTPFKSLGDMIFVKRSEHQPSSGSVVVHYIRSTVKFSIANFRSIETSTSAFTKEVAISIAVWRAIAFIVSVQAIKNTVTSLAIVQTPIPEVVCLSYYQNCWILLRLVFLILASFFKYLNNLLLAYIVHNV